MLARWPLLHMAAMAVVATVFAMLFWRTFTEALPAYVAAIFALPPGIALFKAPREPGPDRNRMYAMAWVLLVGMLLVYTFLSSSAL